MVFCFAAKQLIKRVSAVVVSIMLLAPSLQSFALSGGLKNAHLSGSHEGGGVLDSVDLEELERYAVAQGLGERDVLLVSALEDGSLVASEVVEDALESAATSEETALEAAASLVRTYADRATYASSTPHIIAAVAKGAALGSIFGAVLGKFKRSNIFLGASIGVLLHGVVTIFILDIYGDGMAHQEGVFYEAPPTAGGEESAGVVGSDVELESPALEEGSPAAGG